MKKNKNQPLKCAQRKIREYKALRSVPASTWMEGFCVTKQMEEACMCLMSGEVSVTAQSQTVSRAHRSLLPVASGQHG